MTTVAEAVAAIERTSKPKRVERRDQYARFYSSKAWRAARYRFMAGLSKPLKCCACGASAREVRLACDHVIPIKTEEGWKKRLTGPFQMLCAGSEGCTANLAKGSHDFTYFGENEGNKQIETS
jgi:hypothetical protein